MLPEVLQPACLPAGLPARSACLMPPPATTNHLCGKLFTDCHPAPPPTHPTLPPGGTTMHIDFALPVGHDLLEGFRVWKEKAGSALMDYGFHMAVTSWSDKCARSSGLGFMV